MRCEWGRLKSEGGGGEGSGGRWVVGAGQKGFPVALECRRIRPAVGWKFLHYPQPSDFQTIDLGFQIGFRQGRRSLDEIDADEINLPVRAHDREPPPCRAGQPLMLREVRAVPSVPSCVTE